MRKRVAEAIMDATAAQYHTAPGTWSVTRKYWSCMSCALLVAELILVAIQIISFLSLLLFQSPTISRFCLCVHLKETFAWHKVGKIPIAIEQIRIPCEGSSRSVHSQYTYRLLNS